MPETLPDLASVVLDLAAVVALVEPQLDATTMAQAEPAIVRAVDALLAVEAVLGRPDVDPDIEAALIARRAELVGGGPS